MAEVNHVRTALRDDVRWALLVVGLLLLACVLFSGGPDYPYGPQ